MGERESTAGGIRIGRDMAFDGWLLTMLIDNNILHEMNPQLICGPEQLRFMVVLDEDQVYVPCEESILGYLLGGGNAPELQKMYNRAWRIIVRLIRQSCRDRKEVRRHLTLCRFRFRQLTAMRTIIPSRLVKRMSELAFFRNDLDQLWEDRRSESCRQQQELLALPVVQKMLRSVAPGDLQGDLVAVQGRLNVLELARNMFLSMMSRPWLDSLPSPVAMQQDFEKAVRASAPLDLYFGGESRALTILFLVDADGGFALDIHFTDALIRMGHRVIIAVKQGFYFFSPTLMDVEADPNLSCLREKALVVHDPALGKNELLRLLREHKLLIISDGTRERMNLCRVSVSFARAWKECDLVIAKGWRNAGIFLSTSHSFTRDILCYWQDQKGEYHVEVKARPAGVHKFSEADLNMHAEKIIRTMRNAREKGKRVMFYSCVIGSIPGQTSTAIKIVNTFVDNLRGKSDNIFVVNPAEHFVDGMDGDDLMFMWERVQRSGYIDIWRFQSVEDIEESFASLGRKVPSVWVGKDSTYSTGCTKEMRIAVDVQSKNREMQIIGPAPRLFFRRSEYGVGKYFDESI